MSKKSANSSKKTWRLSKTLIFNNLSMKNWYIYKKKKGKVMKKIIVIAALLCTLFSTNAFATKEPVTEEERISQIINECYPNLREYYYDGLISVQYLMEETLSDGCTEYNIRYKFVNSYYDQSKIDGMLKEQYPSLYALKKFGAIKDVSAYRYVDRETGKILTNVSYNRVEPKRFHRRFYL